MASMKHIWDDIADALGTGLRHMRDGVGGRLRHQRAKIDSDRSRIDATDNEQSAVAGPPVPTVVFSRNRAPGLAQTFDTAVANGAPTQLTRVSAAARDANRRAALRGHPPAPAGQSLDEYPFASSAQGGAGSHVRSVPRDEQNYQGGVLSSFYRDHGVRPGDSFNVRFDS